MMRLEDTTVLKSTGLSGFERQQDSYEDYLATKQFMVRRKRRLERRQQQHQGGRRQRRWWQVIIVVALFLWGLSMLAAHVTLEVSFQEGGHYPMLYPKYIKKQPHPNPSLAKPQEEGGSLAFQSNQNNETAQKNPWYGWQPHIPDKMECSWRKCFQASPGCATCRDQATDMMVDPLLPDQAPNQTWIPDVRMLYRMRHDTNLPLFPPPLSSELCEPMGVFGGRNHDENKQLLDAVPIRIARQTTAKIKLFCGIYTMADSHSTLVRAIRETWASECHGFLAFSTQSDPRIPAISLPHEGPEEYNNMWQKVRSIWNFVGTHYLQDFDYFLLGGQDMFVLPQNLIAYLSQFHSNQTSHEPVKAFLGRRFKGYGQDNYFNSGGAGYVLSRAALHDFITIGYNHAQCNAHRHTPMEDVMIAKCLRTVLGINLVDTRDAQGRERFHPFSPGTHLTWKPLKEGKRDWYWDYNQEWGLQLGKDCCAPDSVSFHYIKKPAMVRHLYSLLNLCPSNNNKNNK